MQVLKYNTARRSDAVWGQKGTASRRVGPQIAHLRCCRPSLYHPSDTASGLRLASGSFAGQRGSRLVLLESLSPESAAERSTDYADGRRVNIEAQMLRHRLIFTCQRTGFKSLYTE